MQISSYGYFQTIRDISQNFTSKFNKENEILNFLRILIALKKRGFKNTFLELFFDDHILYNLCNKYKPKKKFEIFDARVFSGNGQSRDALSLKKTRMICLIKNVS